MVWNRRNPRPFIFRNLYNHIYIFGEQDRFCNRLRCACRGFVHCHSNIHPVPIYGVPFHEDNENQSKEGLRRFPMRVFPRTMSKEEAAGIAQRKGGGLWKLVFQSLPLAKLQLYYFEYKLITLEIVFNKTLIARMLSKDSSEPKKMEMVVLGNGTTGSVAVVDRPPVLDEVEPSVDEEIQYAYCDEEALLSSARKLAVRLLHRMRGGIPSVRSVRVESVFRPHWVAFYGEYSPGRKVRYKVIPADGNKVKRTF